jgi:hypothetical protein
MTNNEMQCLHRAFVRVFDNHPTSLCKSQMIESERHWHYLYPAILHTKVKNNYYVIVITSMFITSEAIITIRKRKS